MHRSKASWWREYSVFLRSPRWRAVRAEVFARDGYRCVYCHTRRATQAHHLSYHGDWADSALLVSVCTICHSLLHRRALTYPRQRTPRPSSSWRRWLVRLFDFLR
jgi:5-methylcytosine-specific restriction endonuclease McrA